MPNLKTANRLDALVLKAVDSGVKMLGDDSVAHAFYYHVEKRGKMKREEIPRKLQAFHEVLVDLFFQGAIILERRMARSFYDMANLPFEEHIGWKLADYVKSAKSELAHEKITRGR